MGNPQPWGSDVVPGQVIILGVARRCEMCGLPWVWRCLPGSRQGTGLLPEIRSSCEAPKGDFPNVGNGASAADTAEMSLLDPDLPRSKMLQAAMLQDVFNSED